MIDIYRTYPLEMEVLYGFMGKSWEYMGIPSGYVKIAIENGSFIVDLPIKNCDFP